ncbi:hypothetical protein [Microtetraspora sp. NBRC 16547]|uniref:hypothetical protein n=1 Tax=Microtetraspora sp. NBRC 16547 TaxID=3030993 RepID=UPI0024A1BE7B|nr:hypothetical protein [Microtetraspora sp. NBRC 16547]GLX01718.1 hypothetical protein Misp02_58040 [Microtetraspora sp. NBRC 16547]
MRHFFGLLVGALLATALVFGGGWAAQEVVRGAVDNVDPSKDARMLIALGVLAVVGLMLGLVLVGRTSPLAAFVPSIVLLAWTVIYALDVVRAADLAPTTASLHQEVVQAGRGMITLLSTGVYGMLGVALFLPVLMPSRWAGPLRDEEEEFEEQGF